jgi:hypothetical protein
MKSEKKLIGVNGLPTGTNLKEYKILLMDEYKLVPIWCHISQKYMKKH